MDKDIKCLLLDADNVIISEVVEVDAELGDPNCKLIKPYRFYSEDRMEPWANGATEQEELMMRAEDILTIADPKQSVIAKYLELTA